MPLGGVHQADIQSYKYNLNFPAVYGVNILDAFLQLSKL